MMQDLIIDTTTNDLKITNGDFVIGESDAQHRKHLLIAEKGSFKQFPTLGVGAFSYLEGEDNGELLTEINKQFVADGMTVKAVRIENKKLFIDAEY